MTNEEKMLMIQSLLYDVRCNWGDNCRERVELAMNLCDDLSDFGGFDVLKVRCKEFIAWMDKERLDGRFFRKAFPYGYYYMEDIHKLPKTYKDKDNEFKELVKEYITYPEYCFDDYS